MSPPQLLPHCCWIARGEVTLYPCFLDCLFATIPPLHVSSISVSKIPRSLAESNFRELNISTLVSRLSLSGIEPGIPQHWVFSYSSKASNQLTHFCRNEFFYPYYPAKLDFFVLPCLQRVLRNLRIFTDNHLVELGQRRPAASKA